MKIESNQPLEISYKPLQTGRKCSVCGVDTWVNLEKGRDENFMDGEFISINIIETMNFQLCYRCLIKYLKDFVDDRRQKAVANEAKAGT